jgi:hypothetical protein
MTPKDRKLAVLNRVFAGETMSHACQAEGHGRHSGYPWMFRGQEAEILDRLAAGQTLPKGALRAWIRYQRTAALVADMRSGARSVEDTIRALRSLRAMPYRPN